MKAGKHESTSQLRPLAAGSESREFYSSKLLDVNKEFSLRIFIRQAFANDVFDTLDLSPPRYFRERRTQVQN